jgi:cytidylate kinase
LIRRDAYDSTRATAPLTAAADAVALDTTSLTLDEVIDHVVELALSRVDGASG